MSHFYISKGCYHAILSGILLFVLLAGNIRSVSAQPPTITSVSPLTGSPGSTITITGTNFNATPGNNIVYFGSMQASVSAASATSLTVGAPPGAIYERITVLNLTTGLIAYAQYPYLPSFTGTATTPSFAAGTTNNASNNPFDIAVGDLDGDGKPDIAATNGGGGNVSVFRNTSTTGSISYAAAQTYTDGPNGQSIYGVAFGDLNNDGKLDMVVSDYDSGKIDVFINTSTVGNISFAARVRFAVVHAWTVRINDLDADGRPDIVVTDDDQNKFSYFRNVYTGSGTFTTSSLAARVDISMPGTNPDGLAIGDIDGDGKPDIALSCFNGTNKLYIFRNTTSAPGSISFAAAVSFAGISAPYSLAIGDLDGDGKADVTVSDDGASNVVVYPNNGSIGTISFATPIDLATNDPGTSLALADFTGDGKVDIGFPNSNGDNGVISVFANTSTVGHISFASHVDFSASSEAWGLAGVDMDGDGKPDMVVANYDGTTITSYLNTISSSALPLTLLSFDAFPSGNDIRLSWVTSDEINTDMFDLEKSKDGMSFSILAQLPAKNSVVNNSYSQTDNNPYSGTNFYRLKMIDKDGAFTYSPVVSVTFNGTLSLIQVYPNPGDAKTFRLKLVNAENGAYTLDLYNLAGSLVYKTVITNTGTQYDQSLALPAAIAAGTYIISLKNERSVLTQKIIIQ